MGKLKAAIISGKIRRSLGNSNLGKSYVLALTEKASLTKRFLKEMKEETSSDIPVQRKSSKNFIQML